MLDWTIRQQETEGEWKTSSNEAGKKIKGYISAKSWCSSSCDAGQCSVTEPVMSLMQHTAKVILHKPPFNTSDQDTMQGQQDTNPPPRIPPLLSFPSKSHLSHFP